LLCRLLQTNKPERKNINDMKKVSEEGTSVPPKSENSQRLVAGSSSERDLSG
jgi:hypothetical protein